MRMIEWRRLAVSLAAAGLLTVGLAGAAAADTASAGNGGTSEASADGGGVSVGDANTGATNGGTTTVAIDGLPVGEDLAAAIIAAITGAAGDTGGTVATGESGE